jgi:hypothetical protein
MAKERCALCHESSDPRKPPCSLLRAGEKPAWVGHGDLPEGTLLCLCPAAPQSWKPKAESCNQHEKEGGEWTRVLPPSPSLRPVSPVDGTLQVHLGLP